MILPREVINTKGQVNCDSLTHFWNASFAIYVWLGARLFFRLATVSALNKKLSLNLSEVEGDCGRSRLNKFALNEINTRI